jgi:hypothetical protein
MSPQPKTKGKPGNSSPASSRFSYPRPPLGDFTKVDAIQKQSPPSTVGGPAAVYFGASPVASALDPRFGRDPSADRFHTNMPSSSVWSKPDISTLQRIGHFYFALTAHIFRMSAQSDNVLFAQSRNVLLTQVRLGRWTKDNY